MYKRQVIYVSLYNKLIYTQCKEDKEHGHYYKMSRTPQIKIANERTEQLTVIKDLGCLVGEDMPSNHEMKCRIALAKEALNRKNGL